MRPEEMLITLSFDYSINSFLSDCLSLFNSKFGFEILDYNIINEL